LKGQGEGGILNSSKVSLKPLDSGMA